MYLPEYRYSVLVGFVCGIDQAAGGSVLDGFGEWVARRVLGEASSLVWWTVIASRHAAELLDGHHAISSLPETSDALACDDLFQLLDDFLAEHAEADRRSTSTAES